VNFPFRPPPVPAIKIRVSVPPWLVLVFACSLLANAAATAFLAAAFLSHLVGAPAQ
jgi:hypothetical protein